MIARHEQRVAGEEGTVVEEGERALVLEHEVRGLVTGDDLTEAAIRVPVGQVSGLSLFAGQQFATVKLSKAGKSKLSKKSKASVTVTASIPFGSPASAKSKLT